MFQTGPNLFLQSFASEPLTWFMLRVSDMGYESFYAVLLAIVIFGVSFRGGFILLQLLVWSALINSALKDAFALPRPVHVDASVLNNGAHNAAPFTSMGATSFFAGPPHDVLERVRAAVPPGFDDYGFPSGHVQSTTVLWGAAARLWNNRLIGRLAPFVILLMAVSRMYLGRHFLADVLGGAAVGGLVVLTFIVIRGKAWDARLLERASTAFQATGANIAVWMFLIAAPLALVPFYPARGGGMLGVGAGFLAVVRRGLPVDDGTRTQRAERVGMALLVFAAAGGLVALAVGALGLNRSDWRVAMVSAAVPSFLMIWGTVAAARRAGLYRQTTGSSGPPTAARAANG